VPLRADGSFQLYEACREGLDLLRLRTRLVHLSRERLDLFGLSLHRPRLLLDLVQQNRIRVAKPTLAGLPSWHDE
jgi:hypothetical protein